LENNIFRTFSKSVGRIKAFEKMTDDGMWCSQDTQKCVSNIKNAEPLIPVN
jgi:hypothetical protein